MLNRKEQDAYKDWLELCTRINSQTEPLPFETESIKQKRIERFKKDFGAFAKHYFPHYCDADFGWFHKKAAKLIDKDPDIFIVLEWAREHAKSVFADVMIPLWLYIKDEMSGLVLMSATKDAAAVLIGDLQAEFVSNQRFISDFGELASFGDWRDGYFALKTGEGFWAKGRNGSPRGIRKAAKRPNLMIVDDVDDDDIVHNVERVKKTVDKIKGAFYGALSIKQSRVIFAGNRIHTNAILAHIVGDVEIDDPKNEGITHIKVYAIEKGRNHAKAEINEEGAVPSWKERYTLEMFRKKMTKMGYRMSRREYYHEHIEFGIVFTEEDIHDRKCLPIDQYDAIVTYGDPSFTKNKKSDTKAWVTVGKKGRRLDILHAWVRLDSNRNYVIALYDIYEIFESFSRYAMEASFLQGMLLEQEFEAVAEERDMDVPLYKDKRNKPNKEVRIDNLQPLATSHTLGFNIDEKDNPSMKMLKSQFLGFGGGAKDDGPDATEGAIWLLQHWYGRKGGGRNKKRQGKFKRNKSRM
mgnify:FL=1